MRETLSSGPALTTGRALGSERLGAPAHQVMRRAMSSTGSKSHKMPHRTCPVPADMATAIPMPASTAAGTSTVRPGARCGRAPVAAVTGTRGPAGRSRRRSPSSPRSGRPAPARFGLRTPRPSAGPPGTGANAGCRRLEVTSVMVPGAARARVLHRGHGCEAASGSRWRPGAQRRPAGDDLAPAGQAPGEASRPGSRRGGRAGDAVHPADPGRLGRQPGPGDRRRQVRRGAECRWRQGAGQQRPR